MDAATKSVDDLKRQIRKTEIELEALREQLAAAEREVEHRTPPAKSWRWPLKADEYERYARQLVLPSIGIQGQLRLRASSVLIVGAGGLGCPAAAYLAGAGIGRIGVIDGDTVEESNLHRQIAHSTSRIGTPKAESLIAYLQDLNPLPTYTPHRTHLTPSNAENIVSSYDIVLDCTDHPTSRYLISDIAVLLRKPLVSASALRTDGQLMVLNSPPAAQGDSSSGGPCYRCVFPKPPPPESVVSCGEGGILGPVVGVMGVLQALEAIRVIVSGGLVVSSPESAKGESNAGEGRESPRTQPSMLLFSAGQGPSFRSVRMRGRRKDCFACSEASGLTLESLRDGSLDYVAFCGGLVPVDVLKPEERVSALEYGRIRDGEKKCLLLDVREKELFDMGSIDGAVNVPYSKILAIERRYESHPGSEADPPDWIPAGLEQDTPVYVVCRVGNDSQLVAHKLKETGFANGGARFIGDIKGGMRAWKADVDDTMPFA